MTTTIHLLHNDPGPRRRHHARVQQFSRDPDLIAHLDSFVVSDDGARVLVEASCREFGVAAPALKFHARRSMFTGATERPRSVWVSELGEHEVLRREMNGWGAVPPTGAIRLGRTTTIMTIAHELGHHLVFLREPPGTPAHGKLWVARFDEAAGVLKRCIDA